MSCGYWLRVFPFHTTVHMSLKECVHFIQVITHWHRLFMTFPITLSPSGTLCPSFPVSALCTSFCIFLISLRGAYWFSSSSQGTGFCFHGLFLLASLYSHSLMTVFFLSLLVTLELQLQAHSFTWSYHITRSLCSLPTCPPPPAPRPLPPTPTPTAIWFTLCSLYLYTFRSVDLSFCWYYLCKCHPV